MNIDHPLIDAPVLAEKLQAPHTRIFDCRFSLADAGAGIEKYRRGHIPGAVYAHLDDDLSGEISAGKTGRHPLPRKDVFARRLSAWGVDHNCLVVAYDDAGGGVAARLWWLMLWLGHRRCVVLDGGLPAWTAAGQPLDTALPAHSGREFIPAPALVEGIDAAQAQAMAAAPDALLIDARESFRFLGLKEPIDPVAGRIPGAISMPYVENIGADGRFRPQAELARLYQALGAAGIIRSACYCGSGVTAAHTVLAAVLAGRQPPALYAGSWSEWITDSNRAVAGGEP